MGAATRTFERLSARFVNRFVVAGYAVWQSLNLPGAWLHSPFDRWGGWAFLIWLAPLFFRSTAFGPGDSDEESGAQLGVRLGGLALVLLGDLGALHAACHAGLALVLLSFAPIGWRTPILAAGAVSWMPAFGWAGSVGQLNAAEVNALRLAVALMSAAPAFIAGPRNRIRFWYPRGFRRKA